MARRGKPSRRIEPCTETAIPDAIRTHTLSGPLITDPVWIRTFRDMVATLLSTIRGEAQDFKMPAYPLTDGVMRIERAFHDFCRQMGKVIDDREARPGLVLAWTPDKRMARAWEWATKWAYGSPLRWLSVIQAEAALSKGEWLPDGPSQDSLQRILELLDEVIAELPPVVPRLRPKAKRGRPRDPSIEARNEFLYEQREAGLPLTQLRNALKKHPEWEELDSESAISKAIQNHAKRNGLPIL